MSDKLPAFQFYPGDWMKDSCLRSCSMFARGLLVDLLCLCFDSPTRGVLAFADGSAWTDQDIVNAVSGAPESEILEGIAELVRKGVLSRNQQGALVSRRMVRDEQLRAKRKQSGSKGGSKAAANRVANGQAKRGSSSSSSASANIGSSEPIPPKSPHGGDSSEKAFLRKVRKSAGEGFENLMGVWRQHGAEAQVGGAEGAAEFWGRSPANIVDVAKSLGGVSWLMGITHQNRASAKKAFTAAFVERATQESA